MKGKQFQKVACALLALSTLFACSCSKEPTSNGGGATPISPVSDSLDRGAITNALHKITITPSNRTLVQKTNGVATTEYKIVVSSASYAKRAAQFISKYLTEASDAEFEVIEHTEGDDVTVTQSSKYIIVGCEDLFESCGLQMPEEALGPAGYYIKSYGDSLFFAVHMNNGYQMGTIALLKAIVGYDMIAHDTVVFDNAGETLPDIEIIERPDFDYRNYTNWMTDDGKYGMGYEIDPIFVYVGEGKKAVHNIFEYLPMKKHLAAHPKWYYNVGADERYSQLCYTAHGVETEYELMQETMLDVMVEYIMKYPNQNVVTVTQEDVAVCCDCDTCTKVVEKDGSISATIIRYMNDLDNKLKVRLEEYADAHNEKVREIQLAFFAYHSSYAPPTTPVSEDPTLKLNPDITVYIAPIDAKYVFSFYDEENRVFADVVRKWHEYTDNIMAWVYETNYHHYMFPYNTYSSMVDTYYFFKQNGANVIYNEGQRWSENVTCFGKLKEYLDAKAQIDVTISYKEYTDKFFTNYYGSAADTMRQYYNELREWEMYLESVREYGLGGGIYEEIGSDKRFWPKQLLEGWIDAMNGEINRLAAEDAVKNAKLIKHIKIERLFPTYAICTLHEASYTQSEMKAMRLAFKADAEELGLKEVMEHGGDVNGVYTQWGIGNN